ncbi:MAG TPA: hypothetical protein VFD76_10135 [Gemmatimonadales bacterium]|nr:hypothetical protein [Gemmatimonadales bacterium]
MRFAPLHLAFFWLVAPRAARAQHEHMAMAADTVSLPDVSMHRMSSGTAWLPDASPMRGAHLMLGAWQVMAHGSAFLQDIRDFGTRGSYQLGSVNWFMLVATHPLAGGDLRFRTMASAEPWTVGARGYPELLQVAEPYQGDVVTDRQHPHEFLSEAAAEFEHTVSSRLAVSLYTGPVGEPALGPVAYMHRPSAADDPIAPLGHHLQDVTHTSFGVVTVGAFTPTLKLEASAFNGAHPDDDRTNIDPVRLDSYSGRITVNPGSAWSLAGWFGHIAAQSGAHVHDAVDRLGISLLHGRGAWSSALIWGADVDAGRLRGALLVESEAQLDSQDVLFGRAEYVRRTAQDLALVGSVPPELDIGALTLGMARRVARFRSFAARLAAQGTVRVLPQELALFYGSRNPLGLAVSLNVRPE